MQPVADALGDARHRPAMGWHPFAGRMQGQFLQYEMSFNGHQSTQIGAAISRSCCGRVTIRKHETTGMAEKCVDVLRHPWTKEVSATKRPAQKNLHRSRLF